MDYNHKKELHPATYQNQTDTAIVNSYQEQTDSRGAAHCYLHSTATHEEVTKEIKHIRNRMNIGDDVKITVTSNSNNKIPTDNYNPELTNYLHDQLVNDDTGEKNLNYRIDIDCSGTHKDASDIGVDTMRCMYNSEHFNEGDPLHAEVIHPHKNNYTHRK